MLRQKLLRVLQTVSYKKISIFVPKKEMKFNKTELILFFFCLIYVGVSNINAQGIYSLKGKNIYLLSKAIQYRDCIDTDLNKQFGKLYTPEVLAKNKFKDKFLYQNNIDGVPVYVEDVYPLLDKKGNATDILMILKDSTEKVVVHLPLTLWEKLRADYSRPITVYPDEISIAYYDIDSIEDTNIKYQGKVYFRKGSKQKYTFEKFSIVDGLLCCSSKYPTNRYFKECVRPTYTCPSKYDSDTFEKNYAKYIRSNITELLKSFIWEEDLIKQCKQQEDSSKVEAVRKKWVGKEVYYSPTGNFYDCTACGIYDFGKDNVEYKYGIYLSSKENDKNHIVPFAGIWENVELASEYREEQRYQQEQREKREQERQAEIDRRNARYKASLIKKYGRSNAQSIMNGSVRIGFTKEMCIEAWGEPSDINRTVTQYGTHEQWVYGLGCYLYFEGNKLTGIQN